MVCYKDGSRISFSTTRRMNRLMQRVLYEGKETP